MKTEKEKAAEGLLYNANHDSELQDEMKRAKCVLFKYNQLPPDQEEEKDRILTSFLGKKGKNTVILSPFQCDYGYNIEIGDNFFANVNLVILDGAKVRIGNNAFIAPNVGIYTAGHPFDVKQRNEGLEYAFPYKYLITSAQKFEIYNIFENMPKVCGLLSEQIVTQSDVRHIIFRAGTQVLLAFNIVSVRFIKHKTFAKRFQIIFNRMHGYVVSA